MKPTEQNLVKFEKWLIDNPIWINEAEPLTLKKFIDLSDLLKTGVYEAYYDSLDNIVINVKRLDEGSYRATINEEVIVNSTIDFVAGSFSSRPEAFTEAFKKANELLNSNQ